MQNVIVNENFIIFLRNAFQCNVLKAKCHLCIYIRKKENTPHTHPNYQKTKSLTQREKN